jgi:hypothetical protein
MYTTGISYLPREFTSGNGTKQDAAIQQRMAINAMVSEVEISNCKCFFIINVLNWLYRIDHRQEPGFKITRSQIFFS